MQYNSPTTFLLSIFFTILNRDTQSIRLTISKKKKLFKLRLEQKVFLFIKLNSPYFIKWTQF